MKTQRSTELRSLQQLVTQSSLLKGAQSPHVLDKNQ